MRCDPVSSELAYDTAAVALALGNLDHAERCVEYALRGRPDWSAAIGLRTSIRARVAAAQKTSS